MATKLFNKDKFYIIRADKAGVFMGKIAFIEGTTIGVNAIRRLYYWKGALDATQIAKCGVSRPQSCKFSEQLSDTDLSIITNLIEFHPMTDEAINSINSVPVWKQ
ncbi:hypothetical protein [Chitinophaga sp. YIM B06452]|uniref:DUF6948 domain-containing protein n=1 Tax=Chitinophaga sp. YIM B06452 TaxID=3082158 RepID=UPI0031FEF7E4